MSSSGRGTLRKLLFENIINFILIILNLLFVLVQVIIGHYLLRV